MSEHMDVNKMNQAIRITKMHYELHYSQLEIASKEGISKSTVSRILKSAMDMGIIEVRIKNSVSDHSDLEQELLRRFPLRRAVIVPDLVGNQQILLQDVCGALANDLPRYLKNDSVLAVAWGRTLAVLAKFLPRLDRKGISVIQLSGGFSRAVYESGALNILQNFMDCTGGTGYQIPAPAMVDHAFIADTLKQDSQIHQVLEMAKVCETAVFSVGNLERPSVLYEMGLIDEEDYRDFHRRGAVGDCCSHFLNKNGDIFDKEIDDRVVGASLDTIKKIPNKLLIAVGKEKTEVVAAALRGGLADSLYIDEPTAREIVRAES
ncbi:MAG: sugar-binding transcriptional regulator [Clostridiales bacterium]|nr:sugar-binding transcriptional regulator [Clostridiales bacterium]